MQRSNSLNASLSIQHRGALQNRQPAITVLGKVGFRPGEVLHRQREVHHFAIEHENPAAKVQRGSLCLVATICTS